MTDTPSAPEPPAPDEFALGIWWRADGPHSWRAATGGECAAEIQRLRTENERMRRQLEVIVALDEKIYTECRKVNSGDWAYAFERARYGLGVEYDEGGGESES